jgi:hypothetical protein
MKKSSALLLGPVLFVTLPALAAEKPISNDLPLRDVALFSSGVGYFARAGQIDGDARVELRVKAPQISDLLKSLVLFDPKGTIKPVSYSLADWTGTRSLETDLAIGNNFSPGSLLKAFQGAQVRLEKPSGIIEGRILSVSEVAVPTGENVVMVEQLSLLTAKGVQTVRLDDASNFKLLDPTLDAKLLSTLEKRANALTKRLDDGARAVSLNFGGRGTREVRAGYLLETPAWKTSYRLVLGPKEKPYLQGWAIVENTTDEDWKNVNLSLISGRPVSFIQDLAAPVYVARPIVAPIIIGSPRPQTFGETFGANTSPQASPILDRLANLEARPAPDVRVAALENRISPASRMQITPSLAQQSPMRNTLSEGAMRRAVDESEMAVAGARSQAQGEERGELFEYSIQGATSLPRGEAAMIPIVSANIGGEALTVVDSPLQPGQVAATNGFYLRNTTGLHLQGGPITVFSDGIYGGDALVSNLTPSESRLISYAVDLQLAVMHEAPGAVSSIVSLSLSDGVLTISRRSEMTHTWSFKNKSDTEKKIVLQVPEQQGWVLADPEQLEGKTVGAQRFRFTAKPGDSKYSVKWTQTSDETVAVADRSIDDIVFYTNEKAISPALKAKLADFVAEKRRLAELGRQRVAQEAALGVINEDQARIRENMKALDRTSPLFKTYETKLGQQEQRVEKVRAEIERLREAETSSRETLRRLLDGLKID